MRHARRLIIALSAVSLLLVSVAPAQAGGGPKPPKLTDACLAYRQPFSKIKDYQLKKILGGAAIGILTGIIVKTLKDAATPTEYQRDGNGNLVKKSKGSYLPWIIAGAAAGGVAGYVSSKAKATQNQAELIAAINSDFSQDIGQYSPLAQSLADLGNCRRTQIFNTQKQFERGEIDKKTALAQLDKIDKWVAQDDKVISSAAKMQTRAVGAYARAVAMANGTDPAQASDADVVMARMAAQGAEYGADADVSYDTSETMTGAAPASPSLPPPPMDERYVKSRVGANVRAGTQRDGAIVGNLAYGTRVEVVEESADGWLTIMLDGKKAYVRSSLIDKKPGAVSSQPKPAVRRPPPPPGTAVTKLKAGQPRKRARTPQDQVYSSYGNMQTFNAVRNRDRQETTAASVGLRARLTAAGEVIKT